MTSVITARAGEHGLCASLLDSMYRLRREVFHERLQWAVRVENGREYDWFDLIGPRYVVAHDGASKALGCCRLLPTLGPNMLRDIFPELLDGAVAPAGASIWEISRFAIDSRLADSGYGFGTIPKALVVQTLRYADAHGISALVGVTTVSMERLLRHHALQMERLGAVRRIGKVMSLAFRIPVAENLRVVDAVPTNSIAHAA
jgi:acyl homoserine lactone synthase